MGLRDKIKKDLHHRGNSSHRNASSGSSVGGITSSVPTPGPAQRSLIFPTSAYTPSHVDLKEETDEFKLGRFINIGVCGQNKVGKSSVINAICGKHIANLDAQKMGDSLIYKHPVMNDIIFHEINRSEGIRKDFRLFTLVIICFEASVTEADLEVAKRAAEKKVPVIFVCPKADVTMKRLMNFANLNEREGIRETRISINSRPDKEWFQRKEGDRKFYVVACPVLFERSPKSLFDEDEFLRAVTSYMQPARGYATSPQMTPSSAIGGPMSPSPASRGLLSHRYPQSEASGLTQYYQGTPPPIEPSKDNIFFKSAEVFGVRHAVKTTPIRTPLTRSGEKSRPTRNSPTFRPASTPATPPPYLSPPMNFTASVPRSGKDRTPTMTPSVLQYTFAPTSPSVQSNVSDPSRSDPTSGYGDVRVAFIEPSDPANNRGTLMECLLGGSRGNKMTIAPNVAYKHPDYPNASFQLIKSETIPGNTVQRYFETNLSTMTLLVVVFTKHISETDIKLVLQARRFGIKFIFAHSKAAEPAPNTAFSPRAALRKIKASHNDARQVLLKAGLRNEEILIFQVDKKILRYPESYPRADEEDFKEFIAEACGGRKGQHRGSSASKRSNHHRFPSEPSRGRATSSIFGSAGKRSDSLYGRTTPPSKSKGFVYREQSTEFSPTPALKGATVYPAVGGSGTPKGSATVTWQTPQEVKVAVVGRRQVGKSTIINGTLQLDVAPVGESKRHGDAPTSHRHPAHYDLIFEECNGYDPKMSSAHLEKWIQTQNLKSMDYVLIVINDRLCDVDLHIAKYCEDRNIVVAVVATKVDLLVDKGIYDERLTEVAAINKARYKILEPFKARLVEAGIGVLRIFIINGRALGACRRDSDDESRFQFDEADYLRFVSGTIASALA